MFDKSEATIFSERVACRFARARQSLRSSKLGLDPGVWKLENSRQSSPVDAPSDSSSSELSETVRESTVKKRNPSQLSQHLKSKLSQLKLNIEDPAASPTMVKMKN